MSKQGKRVEDAGTISLTMTGKPIGANTNAPKSRMALAV
jgi:hypothetical protein